MKIEHLKSASHPDILPLVVEGWNELVQEGLTHDSTTLFPVSPQDEVVYAVSDDGDVVGCIAWREERSAGRAEITLAYVEPSSRTKGVFKEMLAKVLDLTRSRHITVVSLAVGAENKTALSLLRHWKMAASSLTFEFYA